MSIIAIISFLLPLTDLLWWRWADRAARRVVSRRSITISRIALGCFMFAMTCAYIAVLITRFMHVGMQLPAVILGPIYLWHLLILPTTVVLAGIFWLARFVATRIKPVENATDLSRRQLLTAAAVAIPPLAVMTSTATALAQLDLFRVRRIDVPMKDLPPVLDGMTIAQVSDVHVGRFTHPGMLDKIADATNKLCADLVCLTGDLIDFSLSDLPVGIDFVRKLDPRGGMFMIEGNHDLFESRSRFERGVLDAGIPMLFNDARMIQVRGYNVQMLGMRWGSEAGRSLQLWDNFVATRSHRVRDPDVFPILLSHHPHAFDPAADDGIPLTLAGHTHGGQLNLTQNLGFGSLMFKYWSGLYRQNDSALVVSNGVGNWFPLRINAPAEIVHITLRRQ